MSRDEIVFLAALADDMDATAEDVRRGSSDDLLVVLGDYASQLRAVAAGMCAFQHAVP